MPSNCILWFRSDLRLADNPALSAAIRRGATVLPVFILSPDEDGDWTPGAASRAWLHHSLRALGKELQAHGTKLVLLRGASLDVLEELVRKTGSDAVYWNRDYTPVALKRDEQIMESLREKGIEAKSFQSQLLFEPQTVRNRSGNPYRLFTPFHRHVSTLTPPGETLPAPARIPPPPSLPAGAALETLALLPNHPWANAMLKHWRPGAAGAATALEAFTEDGAEGYPELRDLPGVKGVSSLSPHLHFGELSPRQIWNHLGDHADRDRAPFRTGAETYLRQLVWREFAYHLLFHFPRTVDAPFNPRFRRFPWRKDEEGLRAWRRGRTGYPMVDAGMRELWATGWMHNRARMVVASFLTKHLLVHWQQGARWFWNTLVDADLANNTLGWQWTAGCGADAAPYFRIFNPVAQGQRFDADGRYVRRWIPELERVPDRWLHRPWQAPAGALRGAGLRLDLDYPRPIVEHRRARERALAAYRRTRAG